MTASKYIKIKSSDNKEFSGYLCLPPAAKGPGLLLVQEIFGVNSHIKEVAQLYAQDGFVVLAPDLFWRTEAGVELSDLGDAIDTLKTLPEVSGKIGAIGYCLGGHIAYRLASRNKVSAAVSYYGGSIDQVLDEAKTLHTPLIMHFAELDKYIPAPATEKISAALKNNAHVVIHHYPGVDHGFNCDQRGSYNRQAAMLAFARSSAFLHKHLD